MSKRILLLIITVASMLSASAQQWIDVTENFIKNPNYDGCVFSCWEGTELSAYNGYDNAEHYQKTFDSYQTITNLVPGGKYRVSVSAFYRCGNASSDYSIFNSGDYLDYQYARLYASTDNDYFYTGIALCSSAALTNSLGGGTSTVGGTNNWWGQIGGKQIPNNMEAAHYWFEAGYYLNQLEFTAGADGTAIIGIAKDEWVSEDWTCLDSWRLEYYGTKVNVTGVTLNQTSITILSGEDIQLTATVKPQNATNQKLIWSSTDESIATVDQNGHVTGNNVGKCSIRARSADNNSIYASCVVNVKAVSVAAGALVINELQAANLDMFLDPSFNYGSWIELYNTTNSTLALSGLYVSDDPENLKKFCLPKEIGVINAHNYKVLWFDHNGIWNKGEHCQIPFKLDYDGGVIIISNGSTILAQQEYPEAIARTSYARTTDCGPDWGVTGSPTPGASNNGSAFATEQLPEPGVSRDACLFNSPFTVNIDYPQGATLRYTTDGSTPTLTNGNTSTTGSFNVTGTTVYRFRLFQEGKLPSRVVTRSYIYNNKDHSLPIISVVGNNEDFYGSDHGVFVAGGINGRPGAGRDDKVNWNMDWDRPVNFEYLGNEGDGGEYRMLFNQEVDLARCGGWSRSWTPYSFKLKAAKYYYGQKNLDYAFFPDKPYIKNKTLQIRNGGNDNNCRIKDAALQEIVSRSGLYVDGQEWVPVMHYINGEYAGVINMREPNNKHFAYANYGIDTDEMDQFEISPDSFYVQMEGTREVFDEWYNLAQNAADDDTFEKICTLVDIDEYINYMAVQFYLGGSDWPRNNMKGFRSQNDGKFHFVLFDLDHAFGRFTNAYTEFANMQTGWTDSRKGTLWDGTSIAGSVKKEIEPVTIFLNMIQNEKFKKMFTDRFCVIAGSVFTPERCKAIIQEMASTMEGPMSYGNRYTSWSSSPWNTANDLISNLSTSRILNMSVATANYMGITASRQKAQIGSNVDGASISVNGFVIPTGQMNGYLYSPITLKAARKAGYEFKGWKSGSGSTNYKSTTLFSKGATWRYYDDGSLDNKSWKTSTTGISWKSGKAMIGYNSSNSTTTATSKNLPTYYFQITQNLTSAPATGTEFKLNFTIDDGFIIYVNGTEAARYNMPSGNVSYNSFAASYAPNNPDTGEVTLPASLFKKGDNIIAVEVHNNSTGSTDIMWDASLEMLTPEASGSSFVSTDAEYTIPSSGDIQLTAIYEPVERDYYQQQGYSPVMVNEVSAANSIYVNDYFKKQDWIELYNTTDSDIDIAGMYLSDNEAKPDKYQVPTDDPRLNTIIPAHGYLVLWADKVENKGADIHTSFKLANEGGIVMITGPDFSDVLTYKAHSDIQTYGRYPDGSLTTCVMNIPTISDANQAGEYDTEMEEREPNEVPDAEQLAAQQAAADAAKFKQDNATILAKDPVTENDLAAIDKALADYNALSDRAKENLTFEKAKLDAMKSKAEKEKADREAEEKRQEEEAKALEAEIARFRADNAIALAMQTATADDLHYINSALNDYSTLSDGAKSALATEKRQLDLLKAMAEKDKAERDAATEAEKQLAAEIAKFRTDNVDALSLIKGTADKLGIIDHALGDYSNLSDKAKSALTSEKQLLDRLKSEADKDKADKEAAEQAAKQLADEIAKFRTDNANALALTEATVTKDDAKAINSALTDYSNLSEAAQSSLVAEKALLDALKKKIDAIITDIASLQTSAITIAYQSGAVIAKCAGSTIVDIQVYSTSSQRVPVTVIKSDDQHHASAHVGTLSHGVYVARVLTADGGENHIKFAIK